MDEDGEIDHFSINKITGIPGQEIDTLSSSIPIFTSKKVQSASDYIKNRLDTILTEYKNRA
ncbi:MAG: hypothetical protein GY699_09760 [Desulfobacteraceae bacterium]|nr:hypothetical protein [Desulfobacteraceae bacterium]